LLNTNKELAYRKAVNCTNRILAVKTGKYLKYLKIVNFTQSESVNKYRYEKDIKGIKLCTVYSVKVKGKVPVLNEFSTP
jgi:hypothetical protein